MLIRNCGFCTIILPFFLIVNRLFVNTLTSLFKAIFSIFNRSDKTSVPLTIEASFLVIGRVLGLRLICYCKDTNKKGCFQISRLKKRAKKHAALLTIFFVVTKNALDDSNDNYSFEIAFVHHGRT